MGGGEGVTSLSSLPGKVWGEDRGQEFMGTRHPHTERGRPYCWLAHRALFKAGPPWAPRGQHIAGSG